MKDNEKEFDLDSLTATWEAQHGDVQLALKLNRQLFQESRASSISRSLNWFLMFSVLDLLFGIVLMFSFWSFLVTEWPIGYLLIPAISVLAYSYYLIGSSVHDLYRVSQIDFGAAVVNNQKNVEKLKANRVRLFKWTILLSPWLGFSALMILAAWTTNFKIFDKLSLAWVIANFVFGFLFIPIGLWITRLISLRPNNAEWVQRVCDSISGKNLANATRFLEELRELEVGEDE